MYKQHVCIEPTQAETADNKKGKRLEVDETMRWNQGPKNRRGTRGNNFAFQTRKGRRFLDKANLEVDLDGVTRADERIVVDAAGEPKVGSVFERRKSRVLKTGVFGVRQGPAKRGDRRLGNVDELNIGLLSRGDSRTVELRQLSCLALRVNASCKSQRARR